MKKNNVLEESSKIDNLCNALLQELSEVQVNVFRMYMTLCRKYSLALHCATWMRSGEVLTTLLKYGEFNVNNIDAKGKTPLHIACQNGYFNCVAILLQHGANMYAEDTNGLSPTDALLYYLGSSKQENWERCLAQSEEAIYKIAKLLFEHGYRTDASNKFRYMDEVRNFIMFGPKEIVELLIQNGYDMRMLDVVDGSSLLHSAVYNNNKDVAQELLTHIDVNSRCTKNYRTPLHEAASAGSITCTELLLGHGAEINAVDFKNSTPLHNAITSWFVNTDQVVECLLQLKAEISNSMLIEINNSQTDLRTVFTRARDLVQLKRTSLYTHILKRTVADMNIVNDIMSLTSFMEYFKYINCMDHAQFIKDHQKEVATMKETMIARNLSVYDVLRNNVDYVARYVHNQSLKQFYETKSHERAFPLYAKYLEASYHMASIRRPLLDNAVNVLLTSLPVPMRLPSIAEQIAGYLKNEALTCWLQRHPNSTGKKRGRNVVIKRSLKKKHRNRRTR